ncbi:hypothetical protein BDV18DRAFT_140211 [Aspergillus unguis]
MTSPHSSCLPVSCLPSISSLFVSCVQSRKSRKKARKGSPSPTPSTSNRKISSPVNYSEKHSNPAQTDSSCPVLPVYTIPHHELDLVPRSDNTILVTQSPTRTSATATTSIRIVDSDTSSNYSSSTRDSQSDAFSVSDYDCTCGAEHDNAVCPANAYSGHACEDYTEIVLGQSKSLSTGRPLPPLPPSIPARESSRKTPEPRMRIVDETILEEDEDEYLEQEQKEKESQGDEDGKKKKHKRATSRRKSMIELFNLRPSSLSATDQGQEPGSGLSLSFSNLHFRFPMPPFGWSQSQNQQQQSKKEDQALEQGPYVGLGLRLGRRRPKSMSALPVLTSSSPSTSISISSSPPSGAVPARKPLRQSASGASLCRVNAHTQVPVQAQSAVLVSPAFDTESQAECTGSSSTSTSPATKKERRMGTIVFPPLGFLSRSSGGSSLSQSVSRSMSRTKDRESTGSASATATAPAPAPETTNNKSLFS